MVASPDAGLEPFTEENIIIVNGMSEWWQARMRD